MTDGVDLIPGCRGVKIPKVAWCGQTHKPEKKKNGPSTWICLSLKKKIYKQLRSTWKDAEHLSVHVDVWQKPTQYCKAIILQLKINSFLKRCSSSLVIKEMQVKTTVRYHFTSIQDGYHQKSKANKKGSPRLEHGARDTFVHCWWDVRWSSPCGRQKDCPQNMKHRMTVWSRNCPSGCVTSQLGLGRLLVHLCSQQHYSQEPRVKCNPSARRWLAAGIVDGWMDTWWMDRWMNGWVDWWIMDGWWVDNGWLLDGWMVG